VIVAAYWRIARDEQRHAQLAFRFVRWALQHQPGLAQRVQATLVSEQRAIPAVQDIVEACLYGVLARRQAA
jgi:hypothetical protein